MQIWLMKHVPDYITLSKWLAENSDLNPLEYQLEQQLRRLPAYENTLNWTASRPVLLKLCMQCQLKPFVPLSMSGL